MTEDLTKKMWYLERMQIFIIKWVHVKSIYVTVQQGTKVIHRIKDMDTFFFFFIITDILANLF